MHPLVIATCYLAMYLFVSDHYDGECKCLSQQHEENESQHNDDVLLLPQIQINVLTADQQM